MGPYSTDCLNILRLLRDYKNVVLLAPPACGKTRLLREVADAFKNGFVQVAAPPNPQYEENAEVPFPGEAPKGGGTNPIPELPSPGRSNREAFPTVFHSGSKQHEFLSGLVPDVASKAPIFKVARGTLLDANDFAQQPDGASLVLVDELNRGPAVELFGDSLVALERDKRLEANDNVGKDSWPIHPLNTAGARSSEYLSAHLYVLVAMNQADASVQPIDVAFLRRFQPYRLEPRPEVVRNEFGVSSVAHPIPAMPTSPDEVVECAVRAWDWVNHQITLGRGKDFQLGHGVFFGAGEKKLGSVNEALEMASVWWAAIYAHLEEVFFSDQFSLATSVCASTTGGIYVLDAVAFGAEQRHVLRLSKPLTPINVYEHLRWLASQPR
jgi:5-methylcytosine-specific restriction protein B